MPGQLGPTSLVLPCVLRISVIRTMSAYVSLLFRSQWHKKCRTMLWYAFSNTTTSSVTVIPSHLITHTKQQDLSLPQLPPQYPLLLEVVWRGKLVFYIGMTLGYLTVQKWLKQ